MEIDGFMEPLRLLNVAKHRQDLLVSVGDKGKRPQLVTSEGSTVFLDGHARTVLGAIFFGTSVATGGGVSFFLPLRPKVLDDQTIRLWNEDGALLRTIQAGGPVTWLSTVMLGAVEHILA